MRQELSDWQWWQVIGDVGKNLTKHASVEELFSSWDSSWDK